MAARPSAARWAGRRPDRSLRILGAGGSRLDISGRELLARARACGSWRSSLLLAGRAGSAVADAVSKGPSCVVAEVREQFHRLPASWTVERLKLLRLDSDQRWVGERLPGPAPADGTGAGWRVAGERSPCRQRSRKTTCQVTVGGTIAVAYLLRQGEHSARGGARPPVGAEQSVWTARPAMERVSARARRSPVRLAAAAPPGNGLITVGKSPLRVQVVHEETAQPTQAAISEMSKPPLRASFDDRDDDARASKPGDGLTSIRVGSGTDSGTRLTTRSHPGRDGSPWRPVPGVHIVNPRPARRSAFRSWSLSSSDRVRRSTRAASHGPRTGRGS